MYTISDAVYAARCGNVEEMQAIISIARRGELDLNQSADFYDTGFFRTGFFSDSFVATNVARTLGPATPLAIAAALDHLDVVRVLLESGLVDVNKAVGYGNDYYPLDCAYCFADSKRTLILELLRNHGANRSNFIHDASRRVGHYVIKTGVYFFGSITNPAGWIRSFLCPTIDDEENRLAP